MSQTQDYHPYECDGPGKCEHCDRRATKDHEPATCWLCNDGPPPPRSDDGEEVEVAA